MTISIGVSDGDAVVANNVGKGETDVDGEVVGYFEGRNSVIGAIVTCVGTTDKIGVFDGKSKFGNSEGIDGATDTGKADTGVCIVGSLVGKTVIGTADGSRELGDCDAGALDDGYFDKVAVMVGCSDTKGLDDGTDAVGATDTGSNVVGGLDTGEAVA